MKTTKKKVFYPITASEKNSAKFLMERMGVSKRELKDISDRSGVSFSRIVELMQLSKYVFVKNDEWEGRCEPCKTGPGKINFIKW
jgi:hypothetical protein